MRARLQRGFTLVEIMISILVLALLIMVGIPSFTTFIQNSKIRAAADGMLNGLQTARNEAIRRNACVQLKIVNGTGWMISTCADEDVALQSRSEKEGGTENIVATPTGGDTVSFNGLGRVVNPNPSDLTAPMTQMDFDTSVPGRRLRIVIPPGGSLKMCDPQVSSGDTRVCP